MISAIFSVDGAGGLGHQGTLAWPHHEDDMRWFRDITEGQVVVMGRRTWDDPKMPKPLPNRINYVVTSRSFYQPGVTSISGNILDILPRLEQQWPNRRIFLIGGAELIMSAKECLDFAYVTYRRGNYRCDTRLDMRDFLVGMRAISARPSGDKMLNFTTYKNIHSEIPLHEGLY